MGWLGNPVVSAMGAASLGTQP